MHFCEMLTHRLSLIRCGRSMPGVEAHVIAQRPIIYTILHEDEIWFVL